MSEAPVPHVIDSVLPDHVGPEATVSVSSNFTEDCVLRCPALRGLVTTMTIRNAMGDPIGLNELVQEAQSKGELPEVCTDGPLQLPASFFINRDVPVLVKGHERVEITGLSGDGEPVITLCDEKYRTTDWY